MAAKKPTPKKKTTRRKPQKASGCQFGKWKIPKDARVCDGGTVDGGNYGRVPFPDYDPEDGDWDRR
jgi:hypothetical protein